MILVVGSTGMLGGMITRKLLERGHQVKILVRSRSPYLQLAEEGAEPVLGDLKNPESLYPACKDVDVVITTANSALRGGEDTVEAVDLKGNHDLIDAAKAAGVRHFIFTSIIGQMVNLPAPFPQAKLKTEEHLKASGIPYTILAPNAFMEVWPGFVIGIPAVQGQPVTLVGEGRRKHSFVSIGDVAEFAVTAVRNPAAINKTISIGGPEPLSFRDCIAMYESALGRTIPVHSVAPGEPVPGLAPGAAALFPVFEMFDSPVEMVDNVATFGVALTPFDEVVRRQVNEVMLITPA